MSVSINTKDSARLSQWTRKFHTKFAGTMFHALNVLAKILMWLWGISKSSIWIKYNHVLLSQGSIHCTIKWWTEIPMSSPKCLIPFEIISQLLNPNSIISYVIIMSWPFKTKSIHIDLFKNGWINVCLAIIL